MKTCYRNGGKGIDVCSDEHLDTIEKLAESMIMNVGNVFCGDYIDESDKCLKLGDPPKKKSNQKTTRSFFLPIIDVFTSFREV